MSFLSIIVVFLSTWWMIFFMLLPVGVRHDDPEIIGHQSGAPDNPMMKKSWSGQHWRPSLFRVSFCI